VIRDIKKDEEELSRKRLNDIYLGHHFSKGAINFEGETESEKHKYKIHIPLVINEYDKTPVFSSVTIQSISPQGNRKTIVITSDIRDKCYKDEARFGEFVFLLAAKLKHDLLCGLDYDKAGFLYSREIVRLIDECKTTKVPPSILRQLRRFHKKSRNHILKNLFFGKDQLWHLICFLGETHGKPRENKIMWWLNVSPENIHFIDETKKPVSNRKLKSLLKNLFPDKYLIKPGEFDEFMSISGGEKTGRLEAGKIAKFIIKPDDISATDKTKEYFPDENYQITALLEEHKTIVGRIAQKEEVKKFITDNDRGILWIKGPPGIGKTALMANLAHELASLATGGAVVFFSFRRESALFSLRVCLRHLYMSLARELGLFVEDPSIEIDILAQQFSSLLQRAATERRDVTKIQFDEDDTPKQSSGLEPGVSACTDHARNIILIDAVDESENPSSFLDLIPKSLPENTYIILSCRPERYIESFSTLPSVSSPKEIDLSSPETISDACSFLQKCCPDWSADVVKQIATYAEGNFLFLRLFADLAIRESIADTAAIEWCRKFGTDKTNPLCALYERYWICLHDKSSRSNHPESSDDINDLMGLLAIAYTPLSLRMIRQFLGKKWTIATFDRVLRYVRQFLLVCQVPSEPCETEVKMYRLFHDTFRSFVVDRLSLDLPELHGKIVSAYCKKGSRELNVSGLDDYGLSYVTRHAALSEEPSRAVSFTTPVFVRHKISRTKSFVPVLEDLSCAIEVSAEQRDFGSTLKFAFAKELLMPSSRRKTLGVEAMLRARSGETGTAIADASFFGDADDELLTRTEVVVQCWEDDPELARDQLTQIDLLSVGASADVLPFDASRRYVSPAALEAAVRRISQVCPSAALHLASAIPEPIMMDDSFRGVENPNWGRAVWDVMAICAKNHASLVDELIAGIENEYRRAFALTAFAVETFCTDAPLAICAFERALSCVSDEGSRDLPLHAVSRYCLWHLPNLHAEAAAEALAAMLRLGSFRLTRPEFRLAVRQCVAACPDSWAHIARRLEEGDAKDLIAWQLCELGDSSFSEPKNFKNEEIRELLYADEIGRISRADPIMAAEMASRIGTLQGCAKAVAAVVEAVAEHDQSRAAALVEAFLGSRSVKEDPIGFWAVLELVHAVIRWPGEICRKVLMWCSDVARELEPKSLRSDASLALNKLLAKAVVQATPNEPVFFREVVGEAGSEMGREILANRIMEELPEENCHAVAAHLTSFGLGEDEFDVLRPEERVLFMPETKAKLLSLVASRIGSKDYRKAKELLLRVADICRSLEDKTDRNHVGAKLVERAFRLSPNLALEVLQRSGCDSYYFRRGVTHALSELIDSADYRMSRFVRLAWDILLGQKVKKFGDLYWAKRSFALAEINVPPVGSSMSKNPKVTREWLRELSAFFRRCVDLFAQERHELREMEEIMVLVARLGWFALMDIVREPEVRPWIRRLIPMTELRLAAFRSELPSSELLKDVRLIEDDMRDKDTAPRARWLEIQRILLAATASVDPQLCTEMMKAAPPDARCEFRWDLTDFAPKERWDAHNLMELFRLLETQADKEAVLLTKAEFLGWLGCKADIPKQRVKDIADESEQLKNAHSMSRIAESIEKLDPILGDRLAQAALKRAVEKRDATGIVNIIEAHESLDQHSRLNSLAVAREADAATEKRWVLNRIAKLQARTDIDEAVQTLSRMRTDDSDLDRVLDAVAEAVAQNTETEVRCWIDRIQALANLTESHRRSFIRTLVSRRINAGIVFSSDLMNSLSSVDDWAQAYLQVRAPASEDEIISFEKELEERMVSATSFTDRERAFRISGNYYVKSRPAVACRFYRKALREASKIVPGVVFRLYMSEIARACLQLTGEHARVLASDLYETTENYAFGKDIRDDSLDRPRSLLWCSVAYWMLDRSRADALLIEAAQKLCKTSTIPDFEVSGGLILLTKHCGSRAGNAWVLRYLEIFPDAKRRESVDEFCSRWCEGHEDADNPLKRFGVWQRRLDEPEYSLLKKLLPECSKSIKAKCHFAFAITHWGKDQGAFLREIDLAVHYAKAVESEIEDYLLNNIWMMYAAAHGLGGVLCAVSALSRAGVFHREINNLLSVALSNSKQQSDIVSKAWEAMQMAQKYVE